MGDKKEAEQSVTCGKCFQIVVMNDDGSCPNCEGEND